MKLPPPGALQSLLRLPLSDLSQTAQTHKISLYLNPSGRVVTRPIAEGGEVGPEAGRVRAGFWAVVTAVSDPDRGTMQTFVNGKLCHVGTGLDPADIRLLHKFIVFGGGKQALSRGGDLRRSRFTRRRWTAGR
jgi:hypothetical protein